MLRHSHGRERRRGGVGWIGTRDDQGQSTLEYALVLISFLALVVALGAVWHAARDGRFVTLAVESASHSLSAGLVAVLQDVLAF